MNTRFILVGLAALLLVVGGVFAWQMRPPGPATSSETATTTPIATTTPETGGGTTAGTGNTAGTAGAHCGGFIKDAPTCAAGYHCVLTPGRPDTGGMCVADTSASGVKGSVLLGPTCPVERTPPDPQCADKPYATTITARSAGGTVAGTTHSNADGAFTLALPAGIYTLSASGGQVLPRCADISVTVPRSGYATTSISCDTGIR